MYDRFGAPRVDDGLVSTKHSLITQPGGPKISAHQLDLNLNLNSYQNSNSNNNNNNNIIISETETAHLEIETNRKEDKAPNVTITTTPSPTPPPSPRDSLQAIAEALGANKEKLKTTATNSNQASSTTNQISENIRTLLRVSGPLGESHSTSQQRATTSSATPASSSSSSSAKQSASSAYQLRALTGNKIEKQQIEHHLKQPLDINTLSLNLIEETLNYFISCKHRLSQITKTFDDSNALIMLLQEKEEDLEVVGQLGQDLLRRYNELREAYEGQRQELAKFQEELTRCQDDNQQLRYDLASNRSLLDTFKEEEEHLLDQANTTSGSRVCGQCQPQPADEEGQPFSLRSQAERSLTYLENELYKQMCELKDELLEVRERESVQKMLQQERALQLEVQLRDTERRQNDLEGENETLRDQQRELQQVIETQSRRFDELLRIFTEYQHEQSRLQQLASNQDNLTSSFFNYQIECSPSLDSQLNSLLFLDQSSHYQHDTHHSNHHQHHRMHTSSARQTTTAASSQEHQDHHKHHHRQQQQQQQQQQQLQQQNQQIVRPIVRKSSSGNLVSSTSLHEELLESMMHKNSSTPLGLRESDDEDEAELDAETSNTIGQSDFDSGLHTRNMSTSTTPVNSCLDTDTEIASLKTASPLDVNNNSNNNSDNKPDQPTPNNRLNCLGLSTFTLTTLLLLCLSATFNSTTNSNLAQKLQQINLNQ